MESPFPPDVEELLGDLSAPSDLVSEDDLADLLGVTARNVRELVADGVIERRGPAQYSQRQAVRAYCARLRDQGRRRGTADPELRAEKIRMAKEQADKLELANAISRREFLPASEVETTWATILREVRAGLLALPSRLPQLLPHLTPHDVRTIDTEVRGVLEERARAS